MKFGPLVFLIVQIQCFLARSRNVDSKVDQFRLDSDVRSNTSNPIVYLRAKRSIGFGYDQNWNIPGWVPLGHWHTRWLGEETYNKWIVLSFYQEVFGDKNVDAADKYIDAKTYIQHNPHVADGLVAFKTAARQWFNGAIREKVDFQRIGADGDLVWVHTKSNDEGHVQSVIDIFKLYCGKIVEHWDVMQRVPENSANAHPMFSFLEIRFNKI